MKAIAIGALGLALIAGTAYKFLHEPDKQDEKTTKVEDVGVKDQNNPTDQQNPNGPVIPPNGPAMPQDPNNPGVQHNPTGPVTPGINRRYPAAPPDETADDQPGPAHSGSGTMVARLLSAINTRTASQGDTFTAKVEDGPYRGGILTGTIRKLKKSKKNVDLELEFNKLNEKPIPVGLDLVDITNAHGVKGV